MFRKLSAPSTVAAIVGLIAPFGVYAQSPSPDQQSPIADEIIITASPLRGDKVAVPVSHLSQGEIDAKGGASIGEALAGELGIAQSGFATGASRPIIRGLDNFRVRLQENGIASQGVSALSEDHGAPIDPLSAERIEVLRGPAVLRYGSQAIGGVVTILNDRIGATPTDAGISGRAYVGASSVDNGRVAAAVVNGAHGNIRTHLDGFVRHAKDYDLPATSGRQLDSFARTKGGSFGLSGLLENGYVGVSGGRYDSRYGIPAAEERLFIDMRQTKLNLAGALHDLSFEAGWSDYQHHEIERATGDVGSTFNNEEWEARAEYLFTLSHAQGFDTDAAIGAQVSGRDLSAAGEGGELLAPVKSDAAALFGFTETPLTDRLTLQTGLRLERVTQQGFGVRPPNLQGVVAAQPIDNFGNQQKRDFNLVSSSVAMVFTDTAARMISLGINYAERAPAAPELFSKGPHEATETFEIGNPDLQKEKALSAELRATGQRDNTSIDLNLFYTKFDGFIHKQFTGFVCGDDFATCGVAGAPGVDDELTQIVFTQQDAAFYGLETKLAHWIGTYHGIDVSVEGQFDMVRARLSGGSNVPRITPMRVGGELLLGTDNVSAGLGLTHTFKQTKVADNESPTKGFNNVRLQLLYTPPVDRDIVIGIVGDNLFDDVRRNHVSFKKTDVIMPGRNVRLFLRTAF